MIADYQDEYAEQKIFTVIFQGELEAVAKIIYMNMEQSKSEPHVIISVATR